ncbi:MAG: ribosome silencing factor [Treponema sp.]|jgi:ribosome-associated protein|nr:ribosome silencing factor [Treponema sp.]
MADMSQADKGGLLARELGILLTEHQGREVTALDLRGLNSWTDFFVIATVSSGAHLSGLERHIKDYCREHEVEILRRSCRPDKGRDGQGSRAQDEWRILDLGVLVIHLMSKRAREFYELERLWSEALVIYGPAE